MTTTRCARLRSVGAPVTIEDVTLADPGDGEVLVTLDRAGLNPLDLYAIGGSVGDTAHLPRTLGVEGTGTVDGRRVVVHGPGLGLSRDGTFGGAVVVPAEYATEIPDGVSPEQASAVAIAGVTAWRVVRELARVDPLDRVVVLGAAGGVGALVAQLAKAAGAVVWGQTTTPAKREFVAGLGVDEVVVAGAEGLPAALAALTPTVVFDPLGGAFLAASVHAAAPDGRIVSYGASAGGEASIDVRTFYRKGLRMLGYGGGREPLARIAEGIASVAAEIASGRLAVPLGEVVPLDRFGEAVAHLRSHSMTGKIVLDVRS